METIGKNGLRFRQAIAQANGLAVPNICRRPCVDPRRDVVVPAGTIFNHVTTSTTWVHHDTNRLFASYSEFDATVYCGFFAESLAATNPEIFCYKMRSRTAVRCAGRTMMKKLVDELLADSAMRHHVAEAAMDTLRQKESLPENVLADIGVRIIAGCDDREKTYSLVERFGPYWKKVWPRIQTTLLSMGYDAMLDLNDMRIDNMICAETPIIIIDVGSFEIEGVCRLSHETRLKNMERSLQWQA